MKRREGMTRRVLAALVAGAAARGQSSDGAGEGEKLKRAVAAVGAVRVPKDKQPALRFEP